MLADNRIDLAFVTRDPSLRLNGDFIRREPVEWVSKRDESRLWQARPLPVALYEPGCAARAHTVAALDRAGVPYRAAYNSASMLGLLAVVDAGLAVAALARCSIPERLSVLAGRHGLPEIEPLDIVVARSAKSNRPTCDFLAARMLEDLSRPDPTVSPLEHDIAIEGSPR
jgi:DNA-binding transcriptional LysR family regulator